MVAAVRRVRAGERERERFRAARVSTRTTLYTRGVAARLRRGGARRRRCSPTRIAQGDRRLLASVGAVALVRTLLTQRACSRAPPKACSRRRTSRRAAAAARRGRRVDRARSAAPRRGGGALEGRHPAVRATSWSTRRRTSRRCSCACSPRRARRHSMTVLGDLAQATGPASPGSWEETLAHLGRPGERGDGGAHDGLPASGACARAREPPARRRRARHRAVAIGAPRRRSARLCIAFDRRARRPGRPRDASRWRCRARDGRGDRGRRRSRRGVARRDRGAGRRARRAGRGRARPSDRGGARAARRRASSSTA